MDAEGKFADFRFFPALWTARESLVLIWIEKKCVLPF
jgi:hypothetical protein